MIGQQLVDSLQQEIIRLRALLEASQRENYENIMQKAKMFSDPDIGGILRLRREVEGLRAHEQDLLLGLAETRELEIIRRDDDLRRREVEDLRV